MKTSITELKTLPIDVWKCPNCKPGLFIVNKADAAGAHLICEACDFKEFRPSKRSIVKVKNV